MVPLVSKSFGFHFLSLSKSRLVQRFPIFLLCIQTPVKRKVRKPPCLFSYCLNLLHPSVICHHPLSEKGGKNIHFEMNLNNNSDDNVSNISSYCRPEDEAFCVLNPEAGSAGWVLTCRLTWRTYSRSWWVPFCSAWKGNGWLP